MTQEPSMLELAEVQARYQHFKRKSQVQTRELRRLRSRNKELIQSREKWKAKAKLRQRSLIQAHSAASRSGRPRGHRYSTELISISLKLYMLCRCSLRGTVQVLRLFFGDSIPCKSTISNWLRKAGYHVGQSPVAAAPDDTYSLILDESMVIGQQRMLYALLIKGLKQGKKALKLLDVEASFMAVAASWKAHEVGSFLAGVQEKVGSKLRYVICDTDTTLCKALADLGMRRIRDVGHEIARLLRLRFENQADFKDFSRELAQVKFREIMKPMAYLLPPQARTQARFMNLSHSVQWAKRLLRAWPKLSQQEQETFGFIQRYAPLVEELSRLFDWINPLLKQIKEQGLSHALCAQLHTQLDPYSQPSQTAREKAFIEQVQTYLKEEQHKIPPDHSSYHASSDIVESLFGLFKDRRSPNKLHGVTPSVLILSLRTRADPETLTLSLDVKQAMEEVALKDLEIWRKQQLIPNQVQKRINTLKKIPPEKVTELFS